MLMNAEFWVLVAFLIFFGVFGRQIWAALVGMLDRRGEAIAAELAEASKLRSEAEAMLREAQAARQAALEEAREIIAQSRAEAVRVTEAAEAEAEAQARRRERMALDRIASAEKAALTEVTQAAAEIAAVAARQVIAESFGADDDAALVDGAIAGLPRALRAA